MNPVRKIQSGLTGWQAQDLMLGINIGNTNTQLGVFTADKKLIVYQHVSNQRLKAFFKQWKKITPNNSNLNISQIISAVKFALIVSTNPPVESILKKWIRNIFKIKPLKAGHDFAIPVPILVDEPNKVGKDRLLNALAGYERSHQASIIIDFGTAITFDVVSAKGKFLGGVIAPGVSMMTKALHQNCAFLPLIKPTPVKHSLGKNTQQAIQAGIYYGTIGLVNAILEKLIAELKSTASSKNTKRSPYLIATGGDAKLITPAIPRIKEIVPTLTLDGLVSAFIKTTLS